MGFITDLTRLLSGAVGDNRDNNPDDVLSVKRRLSDEGLFDFDTAPEPHGYITADMDSAIRSFQKSKGLKVDGYLLPGGETETALRQSVPEENVARFSSPIAERSSEVEHDATGRMIRPEELRPKSRRVEPQEEDEREPSPLGFSIIGRAQAAEKKSVPTAPTEKREAIPVPPRKPPILDYSFDEEAAKFIENNERPLSHMYRDSKGYMTVGTGHKINSLEEAKTLPFYVFEGDKAIRPASEQEIEKIYNQVRSMRPAMYADRYSPINNKSMKNIRLKKEDRDQLFKIDLHHHAQDLRKNWPELDTLPKEMQTVMLDIIYNVGGSNFTPKKWPLLKQAIDREDWEAAARESHRNTADAGRNEKSQNKVRSIKTSQRQKP